MRQLDRDWSCVGALRLDGEFFASNRCRIARSIEDADGGCPVAKAEFNRKRPLAIGPDCVRQFEDGVRIKLDLQIRPCRGSTGQTRSEVSRNAIGLINAGVVDLIVDQGTRHAGGNRCHRIQGEGECRAG